MPRPSRPRAAAILAFAISSGAAWRPLGAQLPAPPAERCTAWPASRASESAGAWLARADTAIGLAAARADDAVLRYRVMSVGSQAYQSDRMYPPYLFGAGSTMEWLSTTTGALGASGQPVAAGALPHDVGLPYRSFGPQHDTVHTLAGDRLTSARNLNPWATVGDWVRAGGARLAARCTYRDYPRVVLARRGPLGSERLYVDEKTGFPVKLDRTEHHYLFGDVRVEYVWTTWAQNQGGRGYFPHGSYRLVDGDQDIGWSRVAAALVPRDSAPSLALADTGAAAALGTALFMRPLPPDTVRTGPHSFLLVNAGYTEAVALVRDTVFVLDATQGAERAQLDSAWIGRLFPGRHPVVLVVTDVAWPHVAGVRWWAASGATIVAHRSVAPFLRGVLARRWTARPDLLERRRASARPLRVVGDSATLAGGGVRLRAIDGVASEGALLAFLPDEGFLWGSDFIQGVGAPSLYATEVWRAVTRAGWRPEWAAAQHQRRVPWATVAAIGEAGARAGTRRAARAADAPCVHPEPRAVSRTRTMESHGAHVRALPGESRPAGLRRRGLRARHARRRR